MTHSAPHTDSEQPPMSMEEFLHRLRELWLLPGEFSGKEEARSAWTLSKVVGLSGALYALTMRAGEVLWAARTRAREGDWTQVDELAREGWEELREAALALIEEHVDALEWFEVLEDLDAHIVTWLTDPAQLERVRGLLEQVEWRVDRLIGHGLDIIFDQASPSSPVARLMDHRADIERWVGFLLERLLDLQKHR